MWIAGLDGQVPPTLWKQSQRSLLQSAGLCIGRHLGEGAAAVLWWGKDRCLGALNLRILARNLAFFLGQEKERSGACYFESSLALRLSPYKM